MCDLMNRNCIATGCNSLAPWMCWCTRGNMLIWLKYFSRPFYCSIYFLFRRPRSCNKTCKNSICFILLELCEWLDTGPFKQHSYLLLSSASSCYIRYAKQELEWHSEECIPRPFLRNKMLNKPTQFTGYFSASPNCNHNPTSTLTLK